jgi:hypothetical protein
LCHPQRRVPRGTRAGGAGQLAEGSCGRGGASPILHRPGQRNRRFHEEGGKEAGFERPAFVILTQLTVLRYDHDPSQRSRRTTFVSVSRSGSTERDSSQQEGGQGCSVSYPTSPGRTLSATTGKTRLKGTEQGGSSSGEGYTPTYRIPSRTPRRAPQSSA